MKEISLLDMLVKSAGRFAAVSGVIVPGATVLVTQAPVLPDNHGKGMTVMDSSGSR